MKLLTLSDRLWGLGMTSAVYGAVIPALLVLGAGVGKAPARPGALKTFDVALPRPEPEMPSRLRSAATEPEIRQPRPASVVLPEPTPPPSGATAASSPVTATAPAEVVAPPRIAPPIPIIEPAHAKPATSAVLSGYAARLWAHIASRRPRGVRLEGTTTVAFALTREGELRDMSITRRSGNPTLDRLALRTVRGAAPFPTPPEALEDEQLHFTIPFSFQ